jgi:hypothetical protein
VIYLKYNNYSHALGEATVFTSRNRSFNQYRQITGDTVRWDIQGRLVAADRDALLVAQAAFEAAYSVDNGDIGQYYNDDPTKYLRRIRSQDTLFGVKVVSFPSYGEVSGGEGGTYLTYSLAIEADYAIQTGVGGTNVIEFQETLTYSGGGGDFVFQVPLEGDPIRQEVCDNTPYTVVQEGRALGLATYPPPPGPFWPDFEHRPARRIQYSGPVNGSQQYGTSWTYVFESVESIEQFPTEEFS